MNSSLERNALLAGLLVLTYCVQFGLTLAGAAVALPGALLLGIGVTLLWLHLELLSTRPWMPAVLIASAVFLSTLTTQIAFRNVFAEWFTFLAAAAGSAGVLYVSLRNRARCNLCDRRLASQSVAFRCPRCAQTVCEETCWNFEHRRCTLCLEQRVHLLPLENAWWNKRAGARVSHGQCQVCMATADAADLRACPRCRRLQCRDCWDFNNGECGRCAAPLPDLPESLGAMMVAGGAIEQ